MKESEIVDLGNGEWTYSNGYTFKHGQHFAKMYGSCGYVNWPLVGACEDNILQQQYDKRKANKC